MSKTRSCIGEYPLDPPLLVLVAEHVVHEDLEGLALADGVVQHDGLKRRLPYCKVLRLQVKAETHIVWLSRSVGHGGAGPGAAAAGRLVELAAHDALLVAGLVHLRLKDQLREIKRTFQILIYVPINLALP